jgi:hypothetical protein
MWIAIAAWIAATAADIWTSIRMDLFADLREGDPLTRNSQGQFSFPRGLAVSIAEGAGLGVLAAFAGNTLGSVVFGMAAAAHGYAAYHNWRLEASDKYPVSNGFKPK